jgi:putative restriction endonuclease
MKDDWPIGCIVLQQPFFFEPSQWIPAPVDFKKPTQQGKTYDLTSGPGRELFAAVQERLQGMSTPSFAEPVAMYGDPVLVKRRLGQGAFRMLIADLYEKRCAVTGEKVFPVLQAAHIQPVSAGGTHRLDNGLLLRSDVHTLFDQGYVTVVPDLRLEVSSRLKKDFDNGEHYYQYQGREIWTPTADRPNKLFLEWHRDAVFLR